MSTVKFPKSRTVLGTEYVITVHVAVCFGGFFVAGTSEAACLRDKGLWVNHIHVCGQ